MPEITKRDLKALTVLGLESALRANDPDKNNKIIFITSFGYIVPEKIVFNQSEPEELNKDNIASFTIFRADQSAKDILEKNGNEDALDEQASFILENVQIKHFNSNSISNFPNMILFSDQIVGLSFGNISE